LGNRQWPLPTFQFRPCSARALTGPQSRQRVLAENVANSDTPKFHARDLAPLKFNDTTLSTAGMLTPVSLTRTAEGDIEGIGLSQSTTAIRIRAHSKCVRLAMP
jgi:flagellar basal body rod protein FlgB